MKAPGGVESSTQKSKASSEEGSAESSEDAGESAGGAGNVNEFGWEVPEDTLVINILDAAGDYAPTEGEKAGEENVIKYFKEKFNVEFNIQHITGDGTEAVNLALASGDYPDIIRSLPFTVMEKFVQMNKAVDLTPYMDTLGTDLKKSMGEHYPLFLDDEQKLWYVPSLMGSIDDFPDFSAHIRYDEWQGIGAPEIKTPDDYYNALNAILEKYPTTPNGESRYAMSLYSSGSPASYCGFWGLKDGYKIDDEGNFTYWAFTDEGKEMSKFFNRFYLDGTLDPDAFANNFEQWKTKFSNERIITDKAEDPESLLKFINWQATELGQAITGWGLPNGTAIGDTGRTGKFWDIDENGNWSVDPVAKEQLITETWSYDDEHYWTGVPWLFVNQTRWDDGEHNIWPNQMWYTENKWKSMMIDNLSDTIFDSSALTLRVKSDEVKMAEQAVKDAWEMNWPQVVQAGSDADFDGAWTQLQSALMNAGVEKMEQAYSENYKAAMKKLEQ